MWAVEAGSLPVSIVSLPFGCSVHIPTWGTLHKLTEVVAHARARAICSETECFTMGQAVGRPTVGWATAKCTAVPWLRRALVANLMSHQSPAWKIGPTHL